ncbi:hypothetical protein ACK398_03750 [Aeromonas veronii]
MKLGKWEQLPSWKLVASAGYVMAGLGSVGFANLDSLRTVERVN